MNQKKAAALPSKARRSHAVSPSARLLNVTLSAEASLLVAKFCDVFAEQPGDVASAIVIDSLGDALTGWSRNTNYVRIDDADTKADENALFLLRSVREVRRSRLVRMNGSPR